MSMPHFMRARVDAAMVSKIEPTTVTFPDRLAIFVHRPCSNRRFTWCLRRALRGVTGVYVVVFEALAGGMAGGVSNAFACPLMADIALRLGYFIRLFLSTFTLISLSYDWCVRQEFFAFSCGGTVTL